MWNEDKKIIESQLMPDERLLWFGKPRQGFFLRGSDIYMIPFSLLWCGFVVFGQVTTLNANAPLSTILLWMPFTLMGIYTLAGRFFVDVWQRSKTYYGVTNERIIIVSGVFNRKIKSLNIKTLTDVTLKEKNNGSGTITFGLIGPPVRWTDDGLAFGKNGNDANPEFEQIQQARNVYNLITTTQKQSS